jgi:hypothetical protein
MFFSTEHLGVRGETPVDFRNASISAGPSAIKNTGVLMLNSTEFGRGNS